MALQKTLSIVKPDGVRDNVVGKIIAKLEAHGLHVVATKMVHLTREQAGAFYAVHRGRPFYDSLVDYMSSGPVLVQILEGENAIAKNREIMGATDPAKAAPGTIRKEFGKSIEFNVVHGSDAEATAKQEIPFFFSELEIIRR